MFCGGRTLPWAVLAAGGGAKLISSLPRCAFFHGEVDKPAQGFLPRGRRKPVVVAISLEGVHVIDSREKVPPAPYGCNGVLGGGGWGDPTQAFPVPLGLWLAWGRVGSLSGLPLSDAPGASPDMLGSVLDQFFCPACWAWGCPGYEEAAAGIHASEGKKSAGRAWSLCLTNS